MKSTFKKLMIPLLGVGMIAPAAFGQTVHLDDDLSDNDPPQFFDFYWEAAKGDYPDNWEILDTDPDGTSNISFWSKGGNFVRTTDGNGSDLGAVPTNSEPLVFSFRMYDFMDAPNDEEVEAAQAYVELASLSNLILFAFGTNFNSENYEVRQYPTQGWVETDVARSEGWHDIEFVIRQDTFEVYVDDQFVLGEAFSGDPVFDRLSLGGAFSNDTEAFLFDDPYIANDPSYALAVEIVEQPTADFPGIGAVRGFNESITFDVVAEGDSPPLTYQWSHEGEPLSDDERISGAQSAAVTIDNLDGPDSGNYRVVITDNNGNTVTSNAIHLTALMEHELIMNSMDLPETAIVGEWTTSAGSGWLGALYAGQVSTEETERTVTFQPEITETGYYKVQTWFQPSWPGGNRTQEAPYIVQHAEGEDTIFINQQVPGIEEFWHDVGVFQFEAGGDGSVVLSNHILGPGGADAAGLVFADAVRFIPTEAPDAAAGPVVNITPGAAASDVALGIVGDASTTYSVEVSEDLVNWTSLGSVDTDSEGVGDFTDEGAMDSFSRRFYRLTQE